MAEIFWIHRDWGAALRDAGFASFPDFFSSGKTVRARKGKENVVADLAVGGRKVPVFLKRHGASRRPPGIREWENLKALSALGVAVPEALAAGSGRQGSFLMTKGIEGGVPLDDFLSERFRFPVARKDLPLKRRLLRDAASLARTLHEAGLCHRDLYLCHLLVAPREDHRLVLIDLQRVGAAFPFRSRWIVKDLAALHYSAPPSAVSRTDRFRFLKAYLGIPRLDGNARRLARKIERKARRIRRHEDRKSR
jgi:heptose I phosphotransferase